MMITMMMVASVMTMDWDDHNNQKDSPLTRLSLMRTILMQMSVKMTVVANRSNIATGETSPAITPHHSYHFSMSTSLSFITSKLPSQDDYHHLITFTTR